MCCASSRTNCLRVRVKSRRACTAGGGTKLLRINPWAKRSAIHAASVTSLFRPGTFRMWAALASTSSKASSSTCQTGFQYTPVASMATCVTAMAREPVGQRQEPGRARGKLTGSLTRTCPPSAIRTQATTVALCTSNPAQRG